MNQELHMRVSARVMILAYMLPRLIICTMQAAAA